MSVKTLSIGVALLLILFIVELIREEKMTFKYAFGWLILSLLGIVFVVCENLVWTLTRFFGFQLASNFIFFTMLCGFVFLCLIMTIFLCQQNKRNDTIAQKLCLMQREIEDLRKNK